MTPVLPLAVAWVAAVALLALDGRRPAVAWLAVASLAANLAALVWLASDVLAGGERALTTGGWAPGVGIVLRADALGAVFAVLSSAVLLVALAHEALVGIRRRSFPALVLLLATGLTGLFLTGDVFNFFVFFELSMVAAYALSTYGQERPQVGGALVFAVVNLLGSFLFLIAVAALYHVTGTLEMEAVAARIAGVEPASVLLIAVTLLVAFGVKLGLFPFHFWLPPVYASARPAVAAILSGALANIGSYGILRFGPGLLPQEVELASGVLVALGTATLLYGALQALSRRATTEVLAYSAIGQVGYVLFALAVGGPLGYAAAVLYAIVNSLNKTLLFLAAGLRGPLVGASFAIGALSVVGIPPSAGFFGKVAVFRTGVDAGSALLVALIVLGGALSLVYMFQIYQHDHWRRGGGGERESRLAPRAVTFAVAALVVALGLWPEPLLAVSDRAAAALVEAAP